MNVVHNPRQIRQNLMAVAQRAQGQVGYIATQGAQQLHAYEGEVSDLKVRIRMLERRCEWLEAEVKTARDANVEAGKIITALRCDAIEHNIEANRSIKLIEALRANTPCGFNVVPPLLQASA
jgi:hypothetical protein